MSCEWTTGREGTDWTFSMFPPSMLAAASITTAIEGLTRLENNNLCYSIPMIFQLHQITGIELFPTYPLNLTKVALRPAMAYI
ncbi:unnamed protein product [Oppiella nova]|uniref:Uncharacterized protein n=1 Tax=Oppiella nova TaxID=334625 RepID=A0A7R9LET2_9ACAR|nr:unnamed protein product [Oppiella nova]CAG2162941.1 unnamed protein product [Oppiella nova]